MRSRRHPETLNNEVMRTKKAWLTVSALIHPQSYSVSDLGQGLCADQSSSPTSHQTLLSMSLRTFAFYTDVY